MTTMSENKQSEDSGLNSTLWGHERDGSYCWENICCGKKKKWMSGCWCLSFLMCYPVNAKSKYICSSMTRNTAHKKYFSISNPTFSVRVSCTPTNTYIIFTQNPWQGWFLWEAAGSSLHVQQSQSLAGPKTDVPLGKAGPIRNGDNAIVRTDLRGS